MIAFGMSRDTLEGGGFVFLVAMCVYFFLGVSIVCDEFFVPALERMADKWDLSEEIAGATLMAAGGSAPELSTSFVGTFTGSSVGFGTIVGSAVFNILFVIGMCAIFSKGDLELTWWPLFRDSLYYLLSLTVLALFFGVITPDEIHIWEASFLLAMYFGYLTIMKFNEEIHQLFVKRTNNKVTPKQSLIMRFNQSLSQRRVSDVNAHKTEVNVSFQTPFTFRAGILQMMVGQSDRDLTGAFAVTQIKATMKDTFKMITEWGGTDGYIDKNELNLLLVQVHGDSVTGKRVEELMLKLDTNQDGRVDIDEFKVWYQQSEIVVKKAVARHFHDLDENLDGHITKEEIPALMSRLRVDNVEEAVANVLKEATWSEQGITRTKVTEWLLQSKYLENAIKASNEDSTGHPLEIRWPDEWSERVLFVLTLPLVASMWLTIYDVRDKKYEDRYILAFVASIAWIGIFSFFLVGWVTLTGNAVGISINVMGLTFLAAGTSIPDLLSSIIVARKGLGDMAVSSSIGSNIFDVLIGLPLPWLSYGIYQAINESIFHVEVVADTLFVSLLVLILMMAAVVLTIHLYGWKMTKSMGICMFFLYVAFLAQDLIRSGL
eukprot:g3014.t1